MSQNQVDYLCTLINTHLHDFDRVICGFINSMPYFEFEKHFSLLVTEITKKENLTDRNKKIVSEYYSMSQLLDLSYEKWDMNNYEKNIHYESLNSMYVEIYNSCNFMILDFLKIYDSENMEEIRFDENEPISITPYIKSIEQDLIETNSLTWRNKLIESVSLKPSAFGISIDLKNLFIKAKNGK